MREDFIDMIFDCPYELHELVEDVDISLLLKDLSENYREILYYSAVRLYSNVRIAALRNQSDRNIRKTLSLLLNKLRDKLAIQMQQKLDSGLSITLARREFLLWYEKEKATVDSGDGER